MEYYCDHSRHLICVPYTIDNLHAMAKDLGIKRCWFHNAKFPHYDIPKRRVAEIQMKCHIITPKKLLQLIKSA